MARIHERLRQVEGARLHGADVAAHQLAQERRIIEQDPIGAAARVRAELVVQLLLQRRDLRAGIQVLALGREVIRHVANDLARVAQQLSRGRLEHRRREAGGGLVGAPVLAAVHAVDGAEVKQGQVAVIAVGDPEAIERPARLFDVVRERDRGQLVHQLTSVRLRGQRV
jgi:hypothetical protein